MTYAAMVACALLVLGMEPVRAGPMDSGGGPAAGRGPEAEGKEQDKAGVAAGTPPDAKSAPGEEGLMRDMMEKMLRGPVNGSAKKHLKEKDGAFDVKKDAAPEASPEALSPAGPVDAVPGDVKGKKILPSARTAAAGTSPAGASAAGPSAADAPVVRRSAASVGSIGTTSSGRRALRDIGRYGNALDQGFKNSETSLEASGGGPTGGALAGSALGAKPARLDDLSLAALSGRRHAIEAMGLEVRAGADGRAQVLHRDGTPASPAEAAALARVVGSQPRALDRRPDFFRALPPAHYEAVKADFTAAARPGAAPAPRFRDVGLAAQKDFEWTRGCSRVSGACNPLAVESHYERGSDVSPETLEAIYRAAPAREVPKKDEAAGEPDDDSEARDLGEFDADDEKFAEAARAAEGESQRRLALGGIGRRLKAMFAGLGFAGGGRASAGESPVEPAPATTGSGAMSAAGASAAGGVGARAWSVGKTGARPAVPAPGKEAAPRSSRGTGLLGLAAVLVAAAWAVRRR